VPVLIVAACNRPGIEIRNVALTQHWQMQSSARITTKDSTLSTAAFQPQNWYAAMVPGSVLGSLVADSVYKNVFFNRNLEKIPDSLFNVPWWYRTTFKLNKIASGQVTRLQFNGINYRADIWLNGHKIASSDTVRGGFCRFGFDISKFVQAGNNILAVKITKPDSGDLTLGFVDWNPEPPDHNMGIWRDVRLKISGAVSVDQPFVQTRVDTPSLADADLTVRALVRNHSPKKVQGTLKGTIGKDITFSQKISLPPYGSREVVLTPSAFPQLHMSHPRIWWVHTLGTPNLYNLHLSFSENGGVSDTAHVRFGIRSVSSYVTPQGHRGFKLNGKKILIKGGGWTDPMLLNATPAYERAGIDYAVHMNLNAIRMEGFWGKDQHIYNLCDEKGILIMVGLSCQWEWAHLIGKQQDDKYSAILTPEQNKVAARSWRDQILWLRTHPSIFLWLYGSDKWPRPSLEKKYLAILHQYDTTRPYEASAAEHTSVLTGPTRVKMRGPYDYVPPDYWYEDTTHGGAFGFNTETGPGPQVPVLESLKKMIPADSLWPIGSSWLYHAARGNFHNLTAYNNAMDQRLGKPKDLADYLRKAQYLNYEGMRAMYEAFESNRFSATGIIQWMYNASWPKLWWQLYDYYLMPTGAFYGARKAGEPLHISYNYGNGTVEVMNNTLGDVKGLSAEIQVLDFNLKKVMQKTLPVPSVTPLHTRQLFTLPAKMPLSKTWFLALGLEDSAHKTISRNFYVLSTQKDMLREPQSTWYITPQSGYADLTMLQQLPPVKLTVQKSFEKKGDTTFVHVKLKNPTDHLAFMIHLDLKNAASHESVVPVFWEGNYMTLLPGEEWSVSGYCHTPDLEGKAPAVTVEGWNVP
jgi:exo-1,4-beta-D-glucosaminidase